MVKQRIFNHHKQLMIEFLFISFFLYFGIFNKYHIQYLEQLQLFRYNLDFFKEHFFLPGGLANYIGSFFTQFFIYSWIGALIITINVLLVFFVTNYICKYYNIKSILPAIIPVFLIAILQSNELFTFNQSVGFSIQLIFFAFYVSIRKSWIRYTLCLLGWPLLYLLIGGFSIPALLFCALHELLFYKTGKDNLIVAGLYILAGILFPYIFAHILFYIPNNEIYTFPVLLELGFNSIFSFLVLLLLLSWNLFILFFSFTLKKISIVNYVAKSPLCNTLLSMSIILIMSILVFKFGYNRRAETMLGMDHNIQNSNWGEVIKLADSYPDLNNLVIYYTNLALYKAGYLGDKMFNYPQIGTNGLRLKWARNINLFFGGEIFYYLSYTNEACHWAFEAMVANGLNPRSLKRLAITSIINKDTLLAEKYLNMLNQTLFYRTWAQFYIRYLSEPNLADADPEISYHRKLAIENDFFSDPDGLNLNNLLIENPENKMAFEYLLVSLLLNKNLDEFAINVMRLNEYGYSKIPIHFEEALLFYNTVKKKNLIPRGFNFRPESVNRLRNYATDFNTYKSNKSEAAVKLKKKYGNTYWYYFHFTNNK